MNVTATIGTMTMSRKNSRSRVRNEDRRSRRSPMRRRLDISRAGAYPCAQPSPQGVHRGETATIADPPGAIAQLGERLDRTQEVGGSSPPSSTSGEAPLLRGFFVSGGRLAVGVVFGRANERGGNEPRGWPARVGSAVVLELVDDVAVARELSVDANALLGLTGYL